MKRMGFDKSQRDFVKTVTKYHMVPHDIDQNPTNKSFGKFLHNTGDRWQDTMRHGIADTLGKGERDAQIKQKRLDTIQNMRRYKQQMGNLITKPIINGNDVIVAAQNAIPGVTKKYPMIISDLISGLKQRQWAGLKTPEQALVYIKGQTKNLFENYKKQFPANK